MPKIYETKEDVFKNVPDKCDRCGNDFDKGWSAYHFPHIKTYIFVCHICQNGLQYGFFKDVLNDVRSVNKINIKVEEKKNE